LNANFILHYNKTEVVMARKKAVLFPKTVSVLETFGENIRLARLRRNVSSSLQAERAGVSRPTLTMIEKGSPTVSLGSYVQVLVTLGMEKDLLKVAADDELGRKLQDLELAVRRRATKKGEP
jgi:transcriptional regulator with XRE-family HTH domain